MNKKIHSRLRRLAAFTALEILVVLAIIGMLIAVGVTQLDKIFSDSQENVAALFVNESIKTPLMNYRIHMGSYPSTEDGLEALVRAPSNRGDRWRGPYLQGGRLPLDPWGNPYQYRYPGTRNQDGYDVWSLGPDGADNDNVIGNW